MCIATMHYRQNVIHSTGYYCIPQDITVYYRISQDTTVYCSKYKKKLLIAKNKSMVL